MALGRYVSDLETGDVLVPVEFVVTGAICRTFCHGVEESAEWFHGAGMDGRQYVPPTIIHGAKMRLLKSSCPGGDGPYPKILVEYDATHHGPVPADEPLVVSGRVVERYRKRGRDYLHSVVELRRAADGALLVAYSERLLLGSAPAKATE